MVKKLSVKELAKDPEAYLKKHSADEIVAFLEQANEQYYNTNIPLVSDDMFDWIKDYIRKNYPKHPFLKTVGAPVGLDNKVELPEWMGSLDKIRDDPKALVSWKKKYFPPYVVSDKMDGISGMFSLTGKGQIDLFTRGDGFYGQNINSVLSFIEKDYGNVKEMLALVKEAYGKKRLPPYPLLVRGEFIVSKDGWEKIKHKGSNPRNMVAGLLNAKRPDAEVGAQLEFIAYELVEPKMPFSEGLEFIRKLGFHVVSYRTVEGPDVTNEMLSEYLVERRKAGTYDIDGIVVRDNEAHNIIKGKNPKYAFAYKTILTHEEAEVMVYKVEWNVSKDGFLKPTVFFNPVVINGVTIQKATGFNGAFIESNKIGPGSKIVIIRSGDVIPHIHKVLSPSQSGEGSMPDMAYEWTDTHVDIRVKAGEAKGDAQTLRQMEHFVNTLDIKFVGEGILRKMYDAGITDIPKFLAVDKQDLLLVEGIQEKGADKIYQSIQTRFQNTNCGQLMVASNLFGRGFGEKKIKAILGQNPWILEKKLQDSLEPVEGIGKATEERFLENLPQFYAFLDSIGFACKKPAPVPAKGKAVKQVFEGMSIVFTGFRNKEWEEKIEELGGKVSTAVTKKTTLVVAADKEDSSSKVEKAKELGVTLMSREEFSKKWKL